MSNSEDDRDKKSTKNTALGVAAAQQNSRLAVAAAIRELRADLKMTQPEFAALIGKPNSMVARLENGSMNASLNFCLQ